jgi:RNA polymerase sigma-70 factor (ECF subfamily)
MFVERVAPTSEQAEDVDTARLVMRIQAGDDQGVADLYMRYFDRVYSYALMVLRDRHEAEDVTQQVFVDVIEGLPRYERRKQPFRAWLFVIVRNRMVDELKKRNRLEVVEPQTLERERENADDGAHDLSALNWVTDKDLVVFIERMPIHYRQVLVLRYMLDLQTREVARILGRSEPDVRKVQQRALGFLRERLTALGRGSHDQTRVSYRRRTVRLPVLRARRFALLY